MKPVLLIAGTLLFLWLSTQLVHNIFVASAKSKTSILDKYGTETEKEIAQTESLAELEAQYAEAKRKRDAFQKKLTNKEKAEAGVSDEYVAEQKLRAAVEEWERKQQEIVELHFYWWAAFVALAIGAVCFRVYDRWFGFAFMLFAFLVMVYSTSPPFTFLGNAPDFKRLAQWKFFYTGISWLLLTAIWVWLIQTFRRSSRSVHEEVPVP